MRIPTAVMLMGHRVSVERISPDRWPHGECVGLFSPKHMRISLLDSGSKSGIEHSYWHELMHAVTYCLNLDELYNDERFIDTVAGLLHQAAVTAEYQPCRKG